MTKNIIKMPDIDHVPDTKGLGYVYYHSMSKNFNKLAQVDGLTGEKDTYGQLLNRSVRVALHLKDAGVKPGDIVCTCSFNHLNSAVPLIASMFIGAVSTSIHPNACFKEVVYLFKLLKPKIIFLQSVNAEKINYALNLIGSDASIVVFNNPSSEDTSFLKLLRCHQDEATFAPWVVNSLEDTAFIVIKNNATGYPKAVCYSHYTFLCYAMNKKYLSEESLSLCLYYASPSWSVFIANVNMSLIRGGARLIYPRYDPTKAWEMFEHEVTFAFITVLQLANMCKQGVPKNLHADSLRYLEVGGDFAQKHQVLELKKMFPKTTVRLVYGLTEILTVFEASNPKDATVLSEKPMSVGTGVPGYSYKIVDLDTGETLGPNRQGELRVKTKIQTVGYYENDSSSIWDSEGWFKTGDIGYYDEDCCFFVTERINGMFNYQYFPIIPSVLEKVLSRHSAVARSAVVGVPHPEDLNHPLAFVVLKPNHEKVSEEEIEKFVEEKVDDHKRLRAGVRIVADLPVTMEGEINRRLLKDLI